jgi:ribonuclease BN (tRNA processing enzyme)
MLTPHAANSTLADVVALPGDLGRQASEAEVRHLVLGHLMGGRDGEDDVWSLASMDELISGIRDHYSGMITVASDGRCIALRRDSHATRSEH